MTLCALFKAYAFLIFLGKELLIVRLHFVHQMNLWFSLTEEVLQGVAAGIDLFESTWVAFHQLIIFSISCILSSIARVITVLLSRCRYIYHLTLGGSALTFPLDGEERHGYDSLLSDIGSDRTKINLRATVYRSETRSMCWVSILQLTSL